MVKGAPSLPSAGGQSSGQEGWQEDPSDPFPTLQLPSSRAPVVTTWREHGKAPWCLRRLLQARKSAASAPPPQPRLSPPLWAPAGCRCRLWSLWEARAGGRKETLSFLGRDRKALMVAE